MDKNIRCSIIAFFVLPCLLALVCAGCAPAADYEAVYTRNTLTWSGTEAAEDGAVQLDLAQGETTLRLKNDVHGSIGCSIYVYTEQEAAGAVTLQAKDLTAIDKSEHPAFPEGYAVQCAYRGYLKRKGTKDFTIHTAADTRVKLLLVIEDNNSYPKEEKRVPALANVKFSAEVLLDGQYPRGGTYSFSLKDAQGALVETVHNDDGYITFSNIAFPETGTYVYYLSQNEGKDAETTYDKSIYKLSVVVEDKNVARVFYEQDSVQKQTLPRFSNYKLSKDSAGNGTEYPINEKKSDKQPNYLLIAALAIAVLLILFYIMARRKKG